jgi:hypothetical protein
MAMFPPAIPKVFIEWLTSEGDTVWDPFSGRGTTAFEACLSGRTGIGSDMNPLATLLTGAKVDPPSMKQLKMRLSYLATKDRVAPAIDVPDEVSMLFNPKTLSELLWLRSELRINHRVDRYLLAVLAGSLHANANQDGVPRGLTVSMPNTFSMAPGYVRRYIDSHELIAPKKDVLKFLSGRIDAYPPPSLKSRGKTWRGDVLDGMLQDASSKPAKLIFTSPPYLHVMLYGKSNWLRLWLLGYDRAEVDVDLFHSSSLPKYLDFMKEAVQSMRQGIQDDGYLCLVIGDVMKNDRCVNLAEAVADYCFENTDFRVKRIVQDDLPTMHKVSRIWGTGKGQATKTDRILIASAPKTKTPRLPSLNRLAWNGV